MNKASKSHTVLESLGLSERSVYVLVTIRLDGKSQQEVADQLCVGQQRVSQILRAAEAKLEAAGIRLPTDEIGDRRTLQCPPVYMDGLQKQTNGRFRPSGSDEEHYQPWN